MILTKRSILLPVIMVLLLPAVSPGAEPQESVCIQCHGALPEQLGAPVPLWRRSIHAANGISCHDCHGGDAKDSAEAMSPARGFLGVPGQVEIPSFCGRCHPGVLKDYLASAHGKALGKGGPTCATCHGNHEVVKATLALIDEKSCSRCHGYDRARIIKEAMQQTETRIEGIETRIGAFQAAGVDTEQLGKGLFAVRNRFHSLFHEVNVARVKAESSAINAELGKLERYLNVIEESRGKRKVAGAFVVAALLALAFLTHLLRKTYQDD